MRFPDGLDELVRLFKAAFGAEIRTLAGRVNLVLMFLWVFIVLAASLQGLVNSLIELARPAADTDSTSFSSVLIGYSIMMLLCLAIVVVDDRLRKKDMEP